MLHGKRHRCHINDILPDDALAGIFARLAAPADVVRCAATCMRWLRVVATRARALPPMQVGRFLPQLALGVFHLDKDGPTPRTRSTQPRFHAMASASTGRRLPGGCQKVSSILGGGFDASVLDYSRPVASRGGRLVLQLQRLRSRRAITFCVCNPMTGDLAVLPALPLVVGNKDKPIVIRDYGCALLTGDDDLRRPRRDTNFFQLLLVYNHRHFTALRCYSSDTGRWGAETRSPVNVSTLEMRHIGPAVVLHGAAFWALDHGALAVRPAATADDDHHPEVHLLPYDAPSYWRPGRLLGVSPDNRLFFIYLGFVAGDYILIAKICYFHITGDDIKTGHKERSSLDESILIRQLKMTDVDNTMKLHWIGEKSGVVVFNMGGGVGQTGAFALNLREGTVEKLADEGHTWGNLLGFEMDWGGYLASIAHHHVKS